jgi:phosphatidylglycerophosphate synthase
MNSTLTRRELATRRAPWARRLAAALATAGVRPNAVSMAGVAVALTALIAFVLAPQARGYTRAVLFVVAAAAVQLRLLCNLLDGLLAVEQGLRSNLGDLYNEIPDRFADVVILVGAGLSFRESPDGPALGCAAALMALFTAYVRVLGGSLGVRQSFAGPMAKQHRMFVVTMAAVASAIEASAGLALRAMRAALIVIVIGAAATAWRRVERIARELEAR